MLEKKVLLVATVQSHIAQFHRPLIRLLHEQGYTVDVAARDNLDEKNGLRIHGARHIFNVPFQRSPLHRANLRAYFQLKKIIRTGDYAIISCHTPVGGLLTRLAARRARRHGTRIFYTAHGFHFYPGAPRKNWMLYYPVEKLMAPLTDVLITISAEDYQLASQHFKTTVRHIHGVGVDSEKYAAVSTADTIALREELGLTGRFVILCTGELNENKNQKTLIAAMPEIIKSHPNVMLLLAGNGPLHDTLQEQIDRLQIGSYVQLIGYHTDLERFTNMCDMVVSMSIREGLGLNVLEAMLCQKPIVATHNRGHHELIDDGKNGLLVASDDVMQVATCISNLIADDTLRNTMAAANKTVVAAYTAQNVMQELREIYFDKEA